MASPLGKTVAVAASAVVAAVGSALCCAGPLVAVALGLSGAGLAATFGPLRPYFTGATAVSLVVGFLWLRREQRRACEPGTVCASPRARLWMKRALWIATGIALPLVLFPWWSTFVLG